MRHPVYYNCSYSVHFSQVHLELAKKFDELPESPYGEISFRCKFDGDVLQVEVINARDLAKMDSSGKIRYD